MIKKLSDICSFVSGNAWKASEFADEGIPIIRINNMNTNDNDFVYWQGDYDKRYLTNKGDLLVSLSGTIKTFQWNGPEALLNQRIVKVIANTDTNQDWVYYQISHVIEQIANKGKHAVIKNVSVNDLKNFEIDVPDFQTQNKIVAILDKADSIVKKRQKTIHLLDELIKAQFLESFGEPPINPNRWEYKELRDLLEFLTSGSRGWAKYYSDEGDIFLRINNLGYNELLLDDLVYVNAPESAEAKRTEVKNRDVLLSITADLGRTAVVSDNLKRSFINQHIAILRPKEGINPYFLSEYISSEGGRHLIQKYSKGAAKSGLNFNDIKSLKILIPPNEIQDRFEIFYRKNKAIKSGLTSNMLTIQTLFNTILQRAFSGKLNLATAIELDALLEEIDLHKPENDLYSILSNEEYVNSLVERLNTQKFDSPDLYDKAKHAAFQLLKTEEIITQVYDESSKSLKLDVK